MSSTTLRRSVAVSAAALLLGGTLAACSTEPASETAAAGGSISISTNHGPATKEVVAAFEKANPDITVEVKEYAQNYREVVGTQLSGGNATDLIEIPGGGGNVISARVAGDRGFYADLADSSWAADIPEAARQQLSLDGGELVGVPMVLSSIGGIYNQGALDTAGLSVPTTWSEVLQFCGDAKEKGLTAYGLGLSDTWTTQLIPYALTASLVYGPDPEFIDQQVDGDATFADSKWKDAFDQYLEMRDAGCFNESPNGTPYSQVQDAIRQGTTLGTVSIAAETKNIATGGPSDLKLTYALFPATDDTADEYLPTSVSGFAVNAASENTEATQAFVDYLATPEAQIIFANAFGDAAAMPGDEPATDAVSTLVAQYAGENKVTTWPDRLWPSTTVQPAVFDGVQALFNDSETVDGLLTKMDSAFQG
ncbi:extracellular solute-binding protein [Rathayibacter sp. VKM Ac-2835]|uniref:ABC transporter substrate-binding protein n=1 Tax=unclassified Rathayibacter TaxID=2609250 RepID=UPI0010ED1FDB|nr:MULTISPECIES: extracellular solute-binding protein [unclassified Rathayibacter]NRG43066.1 extracellular solute-binding protein [Rathayibacter sp. VKM Ac-2835]TDX74943.1 raffinose/stachyose/melibiose transport system substrate-binding protein [Rathayibacter sp. PhB151]